MVVLDTNVIIDHLRSKKNSTTKLISVIKKFPRQKMALSPISIQELYEGQSTQNPDKEKKLLVTIGLMSIIPYTNQVAKLAGVIARDLKEPIELADAAIAATAINHHYPLFTLNTKHFHKIPKLTLLNL
jgi:predicted nucleic acid-binding protein